MCGHQRVKLENHDIKTLKVYNHILKQIFIFYQVKRWYIVINILLLLSYKNLARLGNFVQYLLYR